MNDRTLGIVLKQIEYRENDALLTVLTKDHGKLSLVARGIKKMTSKNAVSCMPYCVSEFVLDYQDDKSMFTIKTASLQESNHKIQEDLIKLGVAQVLTELVDKCIPQGYIDDEIIENLYQLLEVSLRKLNDDKEYGLLLSLFLAQILKQCGVPPTVDECVLCGSSKVNYISVDEGGFICADCKAEVGAITTNQMDLKRFRLVNKAEIEHFDVLKGYGPWPLNEAYTMIEFLKIHTGIECDSWNFLKKIVEG